MSNENFVFGGTAPATTNQAGTNGRPNDGLGYLNFALPTASGNKQLGSIRLVSTKAEQQALYDELKKNPEATCAAIKEALVIYFKDLSEERPTFQLAAVS